MNYFCGRRGGSGIALFCTILLGLLSAAVARIQTPKQANTRRALRNCSNNQSCPNRNFCNFDDGTSGGCEECPSQNRVCSQMGLPNKGVRHCVNYCFSDDAEDNESNSNDSNESVEDSEDEQEEVEQENGTGNGNSEEEEQESGDVDDEDDSEDEQEEEQGNGNSNSEEEQGQESEDVEEEKEEDDNDENNENPVTIGDNDDQTSYPNNPDSTPPTQWLSISNNFQQHCSPYGISIFAKDWPRDMFLHACNMLAQLLDNDQDGCADDTNVVKTIRASQSGMALFPTEQNANYDLLPETFNFQPLYASETKPGCSGSNESGNCRDAAIEEIFHLVTQKGLSPAYKADFGECDSNLNKISNMQKQMDIARGGHFVSVPNNYPSGSIYTYDDKTCDYACQTTEFIYWALTSLLNGQDSSQISEEWQANTPEKLQSELPGMVNLFRDFSNNMVLFSANGVLPGNSASGATGTYNPPSMTCSNGCGLDGSGCGSQGNFLDVDICSIPSVGPVVPDSSTGECEDQSDFVWINKKGKKKNCKWILKAKGKKNRQKRCMKRVQGGNATGKKQFFKYCSATCARFGKGPCK